MPYLILIIQRSMEIQLTINATVNSIMMFNSVKVIENQRPCHFKCILYCHL